jgi:hypothetical protein
MTGIPCAHAVCTRLFDCGEPENYVDEYYSLEMYKKHMPHLYTLCLVRNNGSVLKGMTYWNLKEQE